MVCIDHTSFNVRVSLICSIIQDTSSLHTILLTQSISQIQNQAEIDLHSDRKPSLISSFASRRNHLSKFYIPLGMPVALTSGLEKSPRTETALSHVCYQWYSISLAYPNLWKLYCGYVQPEKIASSTGSSSSKEALIRGARRVSGKIFTASLRLMARFLGSGLHCLQTCSSHHHGSKACSALASGFIEATRGVSA